MSAPSQQHLDLAARLCQFRKAQGWSLEVVADKICATSSVVTALEKDTGLSLPPVHRRAFLSRYMTLAKLEDEDIVDHQPPALKPLSASVPPSRFWAKRSWRGVRYALMSVVVVPPMVWFGINHGVLWVTGGLTDALLGKPQAVESAASLKREVQTLKASQLPARPLSAPPSHAMNAQPSLPTGQRASDAIEPETLPTSYVLTVRLLDDTWFELKDAKAQTLEHNLLRSNGEHRYQGEPPFDLLIGKASALELALNGQRIEHLPADMTDAQVGLLKLRVHSDGQVERTP